MAPYLELEHVFHAQQGFLRPLREGRLAVDNIVNIGVKSRKGNEVEIEATVVRSTNMNKEPVIVNYQQVRTKYADWKMIRDLKRRKTVQQYAVERLRVNCLRRNDVLPAALRAIADKEIAAFPRDSNLSRVSDRCAITSRPRGLVFPWRLSRIAWRNLADYNKMSGVQRAMW